MMSSIILRPMFAGRVAPHISKQSGGSLSVVSTLLHRQFGTSRRQAAVGLVGGQHDNSRTREIIGQINPFRGSTRFFSSGGKDGAPVSNGNDTDEEVDKATTDDDEGKGDDSVSDEKEVDDATTQQQTVHFPWRHEDAEPTRLLEKDDFSGMPNNWRGRFVRRLIACRELNLTPLDAVPIPFYAQEWEEELAGNFQTAFIFALEELLSSMFRGMVTVERNDESGVISIDSSVRKEVLDDNENVDIHNIGENKYLQNMMDKELIEKYKSVNPDNLQLKLSIRPIEANLESIFAVPLLSREIVETKPHLKGGYQRIERVFAEKGGFNKVKELTYELAEEIGEDDAFTRTVIADMTIYCSEFFQVKDKRSGLVVQGMEDGCEEEEVVHNVRFEVVTEKSDDGESGRKVGSWKIIDIDDMLEGNVFH